MSGMEALYQQVILEHAKRPHGSGLQEGAAASSHQINPTCGDEVTVEVHLAADGGVDAVRWTGHGCAISQASASLLAQLVTEQKAELGHPLTTDELQTRIDAFREAMRSRGTIQPDEEMLGDVAALGGVSRYTARVKCAMLAWVAAEDALART